MVRETSFRTSTLMRNLSDQLQWLFERGVRTEPSVLTLNQNGWDCPFMPGIETLIYTLSVYLLLDPVTLLGLGWTDFKWVVQVAQDWNSTLVKARNVYSNIINQLSTSIVRGSFFNSRQGCLLLFCREQYNRAWRLVSLLLLHWSLFWVTQTSM